MRFVQSLCLLLAAAFVAGEKVADKANKPVGSTKTIGGS
jgi:hypothetical protein